MNAISALKQARTPDQLAQQIEPMAQALATLADQATTHLQEQKTASETHTQAWIEAQTNTARAWIEAAKSVKNAAHEMTDATNRAIDLTNAWQTRVILICLISSIMPMAVLLIASWIWLDPQIVTKDGIIWLALQTNR